MGNVRAIELCTKKDKFKVILAVLNGDAEAFTEEEMAVINDFLEHEIELLSKKKTSKADAEKESIKTVILDCLKNVDRPLTITEMQSEFSEELGNYTNQRLSSLLRQLVAEEKIVKTIDKKKSYFTATINNRTEEI